MAKALTLDELQDLMMESGINLHIWIKFIELDTVYAAVTDVADGVGVVAIWCAGDEDDWLRADTYGIEWLAYLEKPEVSDRWNLVGAHLNGMEPRGEIRKVEVSPWFEAIAKRHKKRMNYTIYGQQDYSMPILVHNTADYEFYPVFVCGTTWYIHIDEGKNHVLLDNDLLYEDYELTR